MLTAGSLVVSILKRSYFSSGAIKVASEQRSNALDIEVEMLARVQQGQRPLPEHNLLAKLTEHVKVAVNGPLGHLELPSGHPDQQAAVRQLLVKVDPESQPVR